MSADVPFYKSGWFVGTAAVVGLVGTVWALVGAPTPWKLIDELLNPGLPANNTEIVLDASAGMRDPFKGDQDRFDAAVSAVEDFVAPFENEGLALRTFGGECEDELLVDFGEDHADAVRDAADEQQPGGASNLANAVIAAMDDFTADEFPSDSNNRVVVFAGTVDDCTPDFADAIGRQAEHTGVQAVFQLVGVKASPEGKDELRALEDELSAIEPGESQANVVAQLDFADNSNELIEVVDDLIEEPLPPLPPDDGPTGVTGAQ